ncbi:MAG: M20/M25/M40 family metallo-hydrolase [Bdellovibrionales bacterium]|nr:M20/M25/M40 family metallo-hydrolase [Bdellovibrionales bacterium]
MSNGSSGGQAARILVVSLTLAALPAYASAPRDGLRLIETAPGQASWMTEGEALEISRARHAEGKCGGYFDITDDPAPPAPRALEIPIEIYDGPANEETVRPLLAEVSADRIRASVDRLSSFHTRHYQSEGGAQAAAWIRDQFIAASAHRSDITVEFFEHPSWRQPSVVARIAGVGRNASEVIVIGGHEDSINHSGWNADPAAHAPGADDNASGTSAILEIFRVLAESGYRPDRTIQFMTYAAEEVGLRGSQAIAAQYKQQNVNVVAAMQFDMTMYPGQNPGITLITDYTNPELTRFAAQLVDTYVGVPWREDKCGYACSDHASWHRQGYAAVFPFEAPNADMNRAIHTTRDTLALLNHQHGSHFAKLGLAMAVEIGTAR